MIRTSKTHSFRLLAIIWILATIFIISTSVSPVSAASFNKNRLIDDSLFTDHDSMSVAQIQNFLEARGSLLANWIDDVDMRRPSDNCIVHHATGMTAAEVIHQASVAWGAQVYDSSGCAIEGAYWSDADRSNYTLETVSPKVILVKLQKEQSLLSASGSYSTNPNDYQNPCCDNTEYKLARALGYGVPDSGGINEKFLGFYNQVNWASWQLRYNFERSAGNTNWDEVGYLTYTGPMIEGNFRRCANCAVESFDGYYPIDGSPLYVSNRATASLYFYTPHTYPGFSGNFNFVQFYSDWFGSVFAGAFSYSYHSQTANPAMKQGFGNTVYIRFTNSGSETWYSKAGIPSAPSGTLPVKIATDDPYAHTGSQFSSGWVSGNTPTENFNKVLDADGLTLAVNQDRVAPGQVVEFRLIMRSYPSSPPGDYQEFFTLTRSGAGGGRLNGGHVWTRPRIISSIYSASFAGQSSPAPIFDEATQPGYIRFKNTGNVDWFDRSSTPTGLNTISLATFAPLNRSSVLGRAWPSSNRPTNKEFSKVYESDGVTQASNQDKVKPGQIAEFSIDFAATKKSKKQVYKEHFKLVREGWHKPLFGPTTWLYVNNDPGTFIATYSGQTANPTITPGSSSTFTIKYKNDGTATWYDDMSVPSGMSPIGITTTNTLNRSSNFAASWSKANRPTRLFNAVYESDGSTLAANQHVTEPGQIVEFSFDYTAPPDQASGVYREDFLLFRSGATHYNLDSNGRFWSYIRIP